MQSPNVDSTMAKLSTAPFYNCIIDGFFVFCLGVREATFLVASAYTQTWDTRLNINNSSSRGLRP
jgi:hypothetical protein